MVTVPQTVGDLSSCTWEASLWLFASDRLLILSVGVRVWISFLLAHWDNHFSENPLLRLFHLNSLSMCLIDCSCGNLKMFTVFSETVRTIFQTFFIVLNLAAVQDRVIFLSHFQMNTALYVLVIKSTLAVGWVNALVDSLRTNREMFLAFRTIAFKRTINWMHISSPTWLHPWLGSFISNLWVESYYSPQPSVGIVFFWGGDSLCRIRSWDLIWRRMCWRSYLLPISYKRSHSLTCWRIQKSTTSALTYFKLTLVVKENADALFLEGCTRHKVAITFFVLVSFVVLFLRWMPRALILVSKCLEVSLIF